MRDSLKAIKNGSRICFTIDGWSSGSFNHYYGVTVHFLNDKLELRSGALDLISAEKYMQGLILLNYFEQPK